MACYGLYQSIEDHLKNVTNESLAKKKRANDGFIQKLTLYHVSNVVTIIKLAICVVCPTFLFENSSNAPKPYRWLDLMFYYFVSGTCYEKVITETRAIQKTMLEKLGINPLEENKNVIVLDDGKNDKVRLINNFTVSNACVWPVINDCRCNLIFQSSEFWEGKRITEMEDQRTFWFDKNLLQKTTQPKATTKQVKPTDLE